MSFNNHPRTASTSGPTSTRDVPQHHHEFHEEATADIPAKWLPNEPLRYPVPKLSEDPWEACHKVVDKYDDDICKAWKDEIDKLLIFAGLFSATVTAFAIESYQWLEDPRDTNTDLLAQLVMLQQNIGTSSISSPSNSSAAVALPPFSPSQSAIRINIFWFLSLILALGSVLIGILCLQWLREYQRPVSMSSKDSLICRQIRYDGLTAWKVPSIISFLPLILQLSLVLFFAGVFDLLWNRDQIVGIVVAMPIALATLFLIITTILPTAQNLIFTVSKDCPPPAQCPYKSPQSWLFHRLASLGPFTTPRFIP
ncbi:hypothetical protein BDN72DRAFT_888879 [Pluteus cervinus]|uniref:Uncharacterized protein n=1 Tax=Pluteus cervinus TaxID=181527 RepID=A0ACD3AR83_9AGAR|nr:hypothetical protein BDN72DRAFT_888879 [Pluteus cervinus]